LKEIEHIRAKTRNIVAYFNHSTVALAQLKEIQKTDNFENDFANVTYNLQQEVSVRWNSTFYMFKRLVLIADCINEALKILNVKDLMISNKELSLVDEIMKLLEPLEVATRNLSGDKYVTASLLIPTLKKVIIIVENHEINNYTENSSRNCWKLALFEGKQRLLVNKIFKIFIHLW
jgi:zinc finger BED domain-containing protein 1 (E3 SUMO-protein ligase ZBED1)